jgi:hypothetical protein
VEQYRKARQPQMTTVCMHITCWIPNATNLPSKCVILIAFLLQQWLHKHVPMLHYERTLPVLFHIICLPSTNNDSDRRTMNVVSTLTHLQYFSSILNLNFKLLILQSTAVFIQHTV